MIVSAEKQARSSGYSSFIFRKIARGTGVKAQAFITTFLLKLIATNRDAILLAEVFKPQNYFHCADTLTATGPKTQFNFHVLS
jgi:hypothetical protein